jgi:UDP-4-amino-4,6-dideoxy-N-acetyl-beta-L-altrosamine N-acetyltransferase
MDLKRDFFWANILLKSFVNLTSEEKKMVRNWRNSKAVRKWMYQDHIISSEEHEVFLLKLKEDTKNFYWLAKDKDGVYLGVISLNRIDVRNKNGYLGIYVNPILNVSGIGNTLIEYLKELAFKKARLHTLKLEVIDLNERAINFYKKFGFKKEGRLKEFVFKDKKWYDVIIMGITKTNGA